jgi:uncharacterized protein
MDVTPLVKAGSQIIQSYAGGKFRISGVLYEGPVLVTPERTILWDAPQELSQLTEAHFEAAGMDVVLLGTGKTFKHVPPKLKAALREKGISIDAMDTGAACRTYNVLMAEGRLVLAALLVCE